MLGFVPGYISRRPEKMAYLIRERRKVGSAQMFAALLMAAIRCNHTGTPLPPFDAGGQGVGSKFRKKERRYSLHPSLCIDKGYRGCCLGSRVHGWGRVKIIV